MIGERSTVCRYKKKKKMLSFVVKKEEEKILFTEGGVFFFFFCVVSVMFFLLLKCDYSGIIAPAGKGKSTLSLMPRSKNREQNHSRKESENLKSIKKSFLFFFFTLKCIRGAICFCCVTLLYFNGIAHLLLLDQACASFLVSFLVHDTSIWRKKSNTLFFS